MKKRKYLIYLIIIMTLLITTGCGKKVEVKMVLKLLFQQKMINLLQQSIMKK